MWETEQPEGRKADGPADVLKVYELLTQEIQSAENQTYQVINVGAGAVAAIIAAGFNQHDPFLRLLMLLTSYLILFPMVRLLIGNRSRIWRISTYMRFISSHNYPGSNGKPISLQLQRSVREALLFRVPKCLS